MSLDYDQRDKFRISILDNDFAQSTQPHKSELPQDLWIGRELYFSPTGNNSNDPPFRPGFVWAIYRDSKDNVQAVELVLPTWNIDGLKRNDLLLDTRNLWQKAGAKKSIRIGMDATLLLPYSKAGNGGVISHAKQNGLSRDFLPDLIVRRAAAICFNPGATMRGFVDIDPSWVREGVYFSELKPENVRSGAQVSEVTPGCRIQPEAGGMDQHVFNQLARWGVRNYQAHCRQQPPHNYPRPLTVHQWPNLARWTREPLQLPVYYHRQKNSELNRG